MNAYVKTLAAAALLPLSTSVAASPKDHWPNNIPENYIFIPPIHDIAVDDKLPSPPQAIGIATQVPVGNTCALTTVFLISSAKTDETERNAHNRQIENLASQNQQSLVQMTAIISLASYNLVLQNHSARDVCKNNPTTHDALRDTFTASAAVLIDNLNQVFPNVFNPENISVNVMIQGFDQTQQPITTPVDTGIIALSPSRLRPTNG